MGKSFMRNLTLKHLLAVISIPLFEGFKEDDSFRPSPHANLKSRDLELVELI